MQILPSSYANGNVIKYILYTRIDGVPIFHYTYRIDLTKGTTELDKYSNNNIESTHQVNYVIPFETSNPVLSIERFYKLLILQAG